MGRSTKPGDTDNQGNHLEDILTQDKIAEVLTNLATSLNQTHPSRQKRDTDPELEQAYTCVVIESLDPNAEESLVTFKRRLFLTVILEAKKREEAQKREREREMHRRDQARRRNNRCRVVHVPLHHSQRSPQEEFGPEDAKTIADFLDRHCTPMFPKEYFDHLFNHTYICTIDNKDTVPLPLPASHFLGRISSFSPPPVPLDEALHNLNGHLFKKRQTRAT